MSLRRLHAGEWVATVAGAALLAVMFADWYRPAMAVGHPGMGFSAWEAFTVVDVLLALAALSALALGALTATQRTAAIPVTTAVVVTALGLVATVCAAIRVAIDQPGLGVGAPDAAVDATGWAWVGLLCCAAIVVGAWMSMRDESPRRSSAARPSLDSRADDRS